MTTIHQAGKQSRVGAIDVAKAIGIFLVVLGHIVHNDRVISIIYSFHMPLFFFLSGITANFNRENYVLRKFKALMIPYFIWAIFFLLYWLLIERKIRAQSIDPLIPIQGALLGFCKGDSLVPNVVLWFLPSLFGIECLAYFINKQFSLKKIHYQLIVLLVIHLLSWGITHYTKTLSLPYCIETVFIAMPFYLVGLYFQNYLIPFLRETKIAIALIVFVVGALFLFFSPVNLVDIRVNIVGNYMLFYTKAFAGILCVLSIAPIFKTNKLILSVGTSTLPLMIFHDPLKRIVLSLSSKLSHLPVDELRKSILVSLILTAFIIALILLVKAFVDRFLPKSKVSAG